MPGPATIDLAKIFRDSDVPEVLDKLDTERVGLKPLKTRIRAIAALPIIAKARASIGLQANARFSTASARRQKSPLSITLKNPWLNRTSLHEVDPMAFIVEQAGGAASAGRERILDMQREALHRRVPVILGSKNEVEWVVGYHNELRLKEFKSPLFNARKFSANNFY